MKIAVTYDNGKIGQHFGQVETFKVYEVEDGKVVSSQLIGTNGVSHCALGGMLGSVGIDTLICGGIGGGAVQALSQAGVKLYGGASGNPDRAIESLLSGQLAPAQAPNCNHHHGEHGGGCGGHGHGNMHGACSHH